MGAPGENGPVVATLYADPGGAAGTVRVAANLRSADLMGPLEGAPVSALWELIEDREAYVNVHTVDHGSGELRGNFRTR